MPDSRGLGCVEFAVPGTTLNEKLLFLESWGMWLELANDGTRSTREVLGSLRTTETRILSVQAYGLHRMQLLSWDRAERSAALGHVRETIEMASEIGAGHVVTTISYGSPGVPDALDRCVRMFKELGRYGEEFGVVVGLEPLGKNRTSFLPGLRDVVDLVRRIGSEHVRPMADTMHIYDNGDPVREVIEENLELLSEVQLRDTDSRPPGSGGMDFGPIMDALSGYGGLVCLEYRMGPDPVEDFKRAVCAVGARRK